VAGAGYRDLVVPCVIGVLITAGISQRVAVVIVSQTDVAAAAIGGHQFVLAVKRAGCGVAVGRHGKLIAQGIVIEGLALAGRGDGGCTFQAAVLLHLGNHIAQPQFYCAWGLDNGQGHVPQLEMERKFAFGGSVICLTTGGLSSRS